MIINGFFYLSFVLFHSVSDPVRTGGHGGGVYFIKYLIIIATFILINNLIIIIIITMHSYIIIAYLNASITNHHTIFSFILFNITIISLTIFTLIRVAFGDISVYNNLFSMMLITGVDFS